MKLGELHTLFRELGDDKLKKHLWSEALVTLWANEAEREACERSLLLSESQEADYCSVSLAVGDPMIELHPRVIAVRSMHLASDGSEVVRMLKADMDARSIDWPSHKGTVAAYIPDYQTGWLRTYRIPEVADTASLVVWRYPLKDMKDLAKDGPEIHFHLHTGLVNWMLHKAYDVKDFADLYDPNKSAYHGGLFEQQFGPRRAVRDNYLNTRHGEERRGGLPIRRLR